MQFIKLKMNWHSKKMMIEKTKMCDLTLFRLYSALNMYKYPHIAFPKRKVKMILIMSNIISNEFIAIFNGMFFPIKL